MNPWLMILIGWVSMAIVMTALWFVQRRTGNSGIVNVAWCLGVGLLSVFFVIGHTPGNAARRAVIGVLAMLWSLRLGMFLLRRVLGAHADGRYETLKKKWGAAAQRRMFRFYQQQALASVFFALPMLIAAGSQAPIGLLDYLGVTIWVIALVGEFVADRQLSRFRSDTQSKHKVCRFGLWKYSRHPNYFFEWLHWWSYVCLAITAPLGWLTVVSPLLMLYFILFVTGVPPTEAQALKSRGDAYREYQRTTSVFFPWPPTKAHAAVNGDLTVRQSID